MGLLAAIRSVVKQATIGIMVTASHNPIGDNGVKLIDPCGEMLEQSWEEIATELVNASDDDLESCLESLVSEHCTNNREAPFVFIGKDTRPSSEELSNAAKAGAVALGATFKDFGVVTTPLLHFVVASRNASGALGIPTEDGYFNRLSGYFNLLRQGESAHGNYEPVLDFDGANGVGYIAMKKLDTFLKGSLQVNIYNSGEGRLNDKCGADFVKVQQCRPHGMPLTRNRRCVSVDGDADRVVYFYTDERDVFHLLDGDKIATLVAGYLNELVLASKLDIRVGVVQTAYANGSSTSYMNDILKVPVVCVSTGVKHLHHKAKEFDIGIYFEANGHGTVTYSNKTKCLLQDESLPNDQREAAKKLATLGQLINQTVGDALSDMLLVEMILHAKGWSVVDWNRCYVDLPNRQLKVSIQDRNVVTTTDAERKCVTPEGIQEKIDLLVGNLPLARSFVRTKIGILGGSHTTFDLLQVTDKSRIKCSLTQDRSPVLKSWPYTKSILYGSNRCSNSKNWPLSGSPNYYYESQDRAHLLRCATSRSDIDSLPLAMSRPSGTEDIVRVYAEAVSQYQADALATAVAEAVYDLAGGIGKRPS